MDKIPVYKQRRNYFSNFRRFYQQKKIRVYSGVIASLLTISFFLFFAIRPTLITIAGLFKEIETQNEIDEKLSLKIETLKKAQQEYQRLESKLFLVNQALPEKSDLPSLVLPLEALAQKNDVLLEWVNWEEAFLYGEPSLSSSLVETSQKISFSLNAKGSFTQLNSFYKDLSKLRRLITFNSFTFKQDPEQADSKNLNLALEGQAHYLPKAN